MIETKRKCPGCKQMKSESLFYNPARKNSKRCLDCRANGVGVRPYDKERSRWAQIKTKYGITKQDFDHMSLVQGYRCAICPSPIEVVDHCHTTGRVRGLLCQHCNSMLGYARDNTETLSAGIAYLRRTTP